MNDFTLKSDADRKQILKSNGIDPYRNPDIIFTCERGIVAATLYMATQDLFNKISKISVHDGGYEEYEDFVELTKSLSQSTKIREQHKML